MNTETLVPILWLLGFYFFVAVEMFLPTAGMAGVLAVLMIVVAVFKAWMVHPTYALGLLAFWVLTTPPLLWGLIRLWPRTPIGRRVLNRRDDDPPPVRMPPSTKGGRPLEQLVDRRGVAITDLLPAGFVRIDGEKVAALSDAGPIDVGSTIRVIRVRDRSLGVIACDGTVDEPLEDVASVPPGAALPKIEGVGRPPSSAQDSAVQSPAALEMDLDDFEEEVDATGPAD